MPSNASFLDARGHILEMLGRKAQAIASFRQALAADRELQSSKDALRRLGARR